MRKLLCYVFLSSLIIGCSKEELDIDSSETQNQVDVTLAEQNVVDAPVETITYRGQSILVQEFEDSYLFEGDILVPFEGKSTNKSAAIGEQYWWPSNVIPYAIDPNLTGTYRVHNAMAHYESFTNVRFVERTTETDYIYFRPGSGCSSYVGQIGGAQPITLSTSCSTGNTIHEIGHALGLWHEQSRADRDQFVDILWENIQDGREFNFETYVEQGWPGIDLTEDLDFHSIMLYGSYAFSANGQPTIVKEDGTTYNAQRSALSAGDRYGLNLMYPANDNDSDNDGVIDSEDECPNTPGLTQFNGCPDSDADGIPDNKDECPEEAGPVENNGCPVTVTDSDGDGIPDSEDECPEEAGPAENNGCPWPDTDGDGVLDKDDNCPNEAGPAENNGCPWPDTDGDGVLDKDDDCPEEAGPAENNGCPWPDTDSDGVLDKNDNCPNEAGPAENNGCPWPDTDGDGVLDKDDNCPNEAGPAENNGCPWPDTDGDGVTDNVDECPTEAGTVENNGCPEEPEYISGKIYVIAGERVLYLNGSWYMPLGNGKSGKWVKVELIGDKWVKPKGRPAFIKWN